MVDWFPGHGCCDRVVPPPKPPLIRQSARPLITQSRASGSVTTVPLCTCNSGRSYPNKPCLPAALLRTIKHGRPICTPHSGGSAPPVLDRQQHPSLSNSNSRRPWLSTTEAIPVSLSPYYCNIRHSETTLDRPSSSAYFTATCSPPRILLHASHG